MNIQIANRELTSEEIVLVNAGFDQLSIEEGVEIESTEKVNFVAMHEDRMIGCAAGLAHKNGDQYSTWFHLTDLFVEKEFRDQGLGAELLKELEEKVKSLGIQNIWLWTSGSSSLRFYARQAYQQFTAMENWYSDGSSRIGLRKNLE